METWLERIEAARRPFSSWERQAEHIIRRYRSKRDHRDQRVRRGQKETRYNALFANVEALQPALFTRAPTVVASRRHRDRDAIGRVAAEVLTRASNQEVEDNSLAEVMEMAVLDVLLQGRGTPWIRYEADKEEGEDGAERTVNQRTIVDHVHYKDFLHSPARSWQDIARDGWIARRVTMTRKEGMARFGKRFAHVELTQDTSGGRPTSNHRESGHEPKYAEVWEVWDRPSRQQIFVAKGVPKGPGGSGNGEGVLEVRNDPYKLQAFFPCPMPAYASLSNEDLIPTPDFEHYRDQAEELDRISARIKKLTAALKLVGGYDSSAEGLAQILKSDDGTMIPIPGLGKMGGGSGGANDVLVFMPVKVAADVLMLLYQARDQAKRVLDELSGVADIVRGAGDPNEKATTAKIKSSFVTSRLDRRKRKIERCARDIIRLMTEMMVELFPEERLREQSGFDFIDEVQDLEEGYQQEVERYQQELQAFQQAIQQPPQPQVGPDGQPQPVEPPQQPQPPPQESPVEQLWQTVFELLRNERMRGFRIDVESGSTVEISDNVSKTERTEYLTSVGNFLANVLPVMQTSPDLAPVVVDLLSFTARTYKVGRSVESAIEEAAQKIRQRAQALEQGEQEGGEEEQVEEPPPEPPPDPRPEVDAARTQQATQIDAQKAQADLAGTEAKIEHTKAQTAQVAQKTEIEAAEAQQRMMQPPVQPGPGSGGV